jgi:hypothetical protein
VRGSGRAHLLSMRVPLHRAPRNFKDSHRTAGSALSGVQGAASASSAHDRSEIPRTEGGASGGTRSATGRKWAKSESPERDLRELLSVTKAYGAPETIDVTERAAISLARLLAKQNKRDEARAMLAEIYNCFSEDFDTPDLKDAKTLLDQLRD